MTEKEKLDKLVAEIKRLRKEVKDNIAEFGNSESERIGLFKDLDIYDNILSFIDSMQEEPKFKLGDIVRRKSDGLYARVINIVDGIYIVECEDWSNSILEYQWELVEEPKECMYSKDNYTDEDRKVLCDGCEEECRFNKKEELVSEKFEKALAEEWQGYVDRGAATVDALEDNTQELAFAKGFYRGSNWQKEQLLAKAVEGKVLANGMGNPILHLWDKGKHLIDKKVKVIVIKEE